MQGRPSFLAGSYSSFGRWHYFPLAFLLKTPLALLGLFLGGVGLCIRRRRLFALDGEAFVILPIVVFLAVSMTSTLNIGLRHILPIYPFVIVAAALGAETVSKSGGTRGRVVVGLALAAAAVEFASVYSDNLAFFNLAVGGPHNGFHYLADSNIDWDRT